jgi:hypothetical protein
VTEPATWVVPGPFTVKLPALMDAGSMASLKVAVIFPFTATFADPQIGIEAVTLAGVLAFATVQLVHGEQPVANNANGTNVKTANHFAIAL